MKVVNDLNNYNRTNFQAFIMPKESHGRFISALRRQCDNEQLLKTKQVLKKEIQNKNHIMIKDLGEISGVPCEGHLSAVVNNKEYKNSDLLLFTPSIPLFLKKMSQFAEKGLSKAQILERKVIDAYDREDILLHRSVKKKGLVESKDIKEFLLEEIEKLINFNPESK